MFEDGDRLQRALDLAYGYLNRRDVTQAEMRRQLERGGIEPATTEEAIGVLTDQGMLDDTRFARLFVEDKRELEQWGSERIRRTLLERGIDRELIEDALGSGPEESELDRALALLRRRFAVAPRDRRERDRALGVMIRKGYDSELALDALAAYAREGGEP